MDQRGPPANSQAEQATAGVNLARLSLCEPSTSLAARALDDGETTGARTEGALPRAAAGVALAHLSLHKQVDLLDDGAASLHSLKRSSADVVLDDGCGSGLAAAAAAAAGGELGFGRN